MAMFDKLALIEPADLDRLAVNQQEWLRLFQSTTPLDQASVCSAVDELYGQHGLQRPALFWCRSPREMRKAAAMLQLLISCSGTQVRERFIEGLREDFSAELVNPFRKFEAEAILSKIPRRVVDNSKDPILSRLDVAVGIFRCHSMLSSIVNGLPNPRVRIELNRCLNVPMQALTQMGAHVSRVLLCDLVPKGLRSWVARESSGNSRSSVDFLEPDFWHPDLFLWGPRNSAGAPLNSFMIPYLDVSEVEVVERVASLGALANHAFAYLLLKGACFISSRPKKIQLDAVGRLHNETEAAIQFDDGYQIFSWHGVTVDQAVIESPETISLEEIKFEQNLEVRRVKIERFGLQRYIIESGAEIVDESEYGVLYRQRLDRDEDILLLKVTNSSMEHDGTFKEFFLRVPPGIKKAQEAVAWTFGLQADEYLIEVET